MQEWWDIFTKLCIISLFWLGVSTLGNVRAGIHFGAKPPILWQNIPKACNKVTSVVLSLNLNGFLWKPVGRSLSS